MTEQPRHTEFEPAAADALAVRRARALAIGAISVVAVIGWIYLGVMVAEMAEMGTAETLGPGMWVVDWVLNPDARDEIGRALLKSLCTPGMAHFGMPGAGDWGLADLGLLFVMWVAMAAAMMLPTAGPMILGYAALAAERRDASPFGSPMLIAAGYLSVWVGAALVLTLAQWGLTRLALLDPAMASVSGLFSGAVFVLAGAYQFSALKHTCVTLCQRPLPFFIARWVTTSGGVFRLGVRQGLFCLGCCWALMLVMFAVGVMNLVWMAALGVIMLAEKVAVTTRFSHAIGVVLLAIGAVIIGTEVIAHWPKVR